MIILNSFLFITMFSPHVLSYYRWTAPAFHVAAQGTAVATLMAEWSSTPDVCRLTTSTLS